MIANTRASVRPCWTASFGVAHAVSRNFAIRYLALLLRPLLFLAICISGAFTLNALIKPPKPTEPPATSATSTNTTATNAAATRALLPPPPQWLGDLRAAQNLAKAQHKDLLIEFTQPLRSNGTRPSKETPSTTVLDSEMFLRPIGSAFVLLRVSLSPNNPPEQLAQVSAWAMRLAVTKFPTFVLLDSEGVPYARSEFVAQAAIAYCGEIRRLRRVRNRRDRELAMADATTGLERARHLDAVLKMVGPLADTEYGALEERVTELDPHNSAGLRAKYDAAITRHKLDRAFRDEVYPLVDRGNYRAAITRLDRLIADAKPSRSQRQLLVAFKAQLYFGLHDPQTSAKLLEEAIALDPQSEMGRRARTTQHQIAKVPPTDLGTACAPASSR